MSTHNPETSHPQHIPGNFDIQPDSSDFQDRPDLAPAPPAPEPLPAWFFGSIGLALFLLGTSFAGFSTFTSTYDQGAGSAVVAVPDGPKIRELPPAVIGKQVFSANCASCHQADGNGQAGAYPPLAHSAYVNGPQDRLAAIIFHGLQGTLTINGQTYNGQMPNSWGTLSGKKLSGLFTYLRSSWGNTGDAVAEDMVESARGKMKAHAAPYSQAELDAMAGDAKSGDVKAGDAKK